MTFAKRENKEKTEKSEYNFEPFQTLTQYLADSSLTIKNY